MAELSSLLDEFFAFWWRMHPTHATGVGLHAYDGELERYDAASLDELARHARGYLDAFRRASPIDVGEAIDVAWVRGQLEWRLHEVERDRPHARDPGIYLEPVLNALYAMAVRDYAPAEDRAAAAAERLRRLPAALDEARENLTAASPVLVRTAAAVARSGVDLLNGVLAVNLGAALEDDPAEFAAWDNALRGAESALVDYATWLEEELLPRATGDFAVGREAFEARLRLLHGIRATADEIAAYGEALKQETESALEAVAREIDGRGDWRALATSLKAEHPTADALIEAYATEMARARAFVEERGLAEIPAGESLVVTATPEFLRPLIPYAAYLPPAAHEVDQTGYFFVTPPPEAVAESVLRDHSIHGIPVTALHEAYPGHHLQFTWANRAATEPRRVFWTSVFAEGWALYCEELMFEQGYYRDPRVRLLQLKDLLWRACRVVIDVGLHVRGWSPERGVAYLVEEAGLEPAAAEIEVRRYCAEPTQPLSYAVGKREILALRERWFGRYGTGAGLREFHDRLLSWGTIPPSLVARGMGLDA